MCEYAVSIGLVLKLSRSRHSYRRQVQKPRQDVSPLHRIVRMRPRTGQGKNPMCRKGEALSEPMQRYIREGCCAEMGLQPEVQDVSKGEAVSET